MRIDALLRAPSIYYAGSHGWYIVQSAWRFLNKSGREPNLLVLILVGTVMTQRVCVACQSSFTVRPQSPKQTYCSKPACQRERRSVWNKQKMLSDPDYRANQAAAQQAWHARHPDYWRTYRQHQKPSREAHLGGVRPTTSDASSCGVDPGAGLCWIEIQTPGDDGQALVWRIELTLKPPQQLRK